jgi:hypothetical protein
MLKFLEVIANSIANTSKTTNKFNNLCLKFIACNSLDRYLVKSANVVWIKPLLEKCIKFCIKGIFSLLNEANQDTVEIPVCTIADIIEVIFLIFKIYFKKKKVKRRYCRKF